MCYLLVNRNLVVMPDAVPHQLIGERATPYELGTDRPLLHFASPFNNFEEVFTSSTTFVFNLNIRQTD